MAANISPRFSGKAHIEASTVVTAANTAKDGTGTVNTIYTATTDGGLVRGVWAHPQGTNVATVCRLFFNNGGTNATATNNIPGPTYSLPATTLSETANTAMSPIFIAFPGALADIPATWKINVVLGTAVAAGWQFMVSGPNWSTA